MKLQVKTDLDLQDIAVSLGESSNNEQALFLNILFKTLMSSCEAIHRRDRQLLAIEELLDKNALECVKFLGSGDE